MSEHERPEHDEERADRQRRVEVLVELRVDRERQRLRHPLQAAGEDERCAELTEAAGKRERRRGAEATGGERKRDAGEDTRRRRAERSRSVDERPVDRLERGDRAAKVERALDEGDRKDDGCLRERNLNAERIELVAQETGAAERGEEGDTGDGRRQARVAARSASSTAPRPRKRCRARR